MAIPNEVFYARPEHGRHLVRFACCKRLEVLDEAAGVGRRGRRPGLMRRALQHDIAWNDVTPTSSALRDDRRSGGRQEAPPAEEACDVLDRFAVDMPDLGR